MCGCIRYGDDIKTDVKLDNVHVYLNTPQPSCPACPSCPAMTNSIPITTLPQLPQLPGITPKNFTYPVYQFNATEFFKNNRAYNPYLNIDDCKKLQMQGYAIACIYGNN